MNLWVHDRLQHLLGCRTNDFNCVCTVSKIVFTKIERFFLHDLRQWTALASSWWVWLTARSVTSLLLVEGLVRVGSAILLLNYEIGRSFQVLLRFWILWLLVLQEIWVLANVYKYFPTVIVFLGPSCYVVIRFLLLETLKDNLILSSDLHELSLACLSIQWFPAA